MEFWNSNKITCWKKSVYWHDRCSKYSSPRVNTIKEYIWFYFWQKKKIQRCTQHIMSSSHSSFCIPHMWTQIFTMPACSGNPASLRSQKTSVHKAVLVSMAVLRMCKEDGEHWPHAVLGTVAQSSKAQTAGQAQPGHSPAAGAAPQQAERAPAGETEPVGGSRPSEIPVTQHATIWLLTWVKQSGKNDLQRYLHSSDLYVVCLNAAWPSSGRPTFTAKWPLQGGWTGADIWHYVGHPWCVFRNGLKSLCF